MADYCGECFEALVTTDERNGYAAFLECTKCKQKYHQAHWSGVCSRCGHTEATTITIEPEKPQKEKRNTTSPKRQEVGVPLHVDEIDLTQPKPGDREPKIRPRLIPRIDLRPYVRFVIELAVSTVLGIFLIGIGTAVGSFTPQVLEANPNELRDVLDAITRSDPPERIVIFSALIGALGTALVVYHKSTSSQPRQWFWRLLTSLVAIGVFQIVANNITLNDIPNLTSNRLGFINDNLRQQWLAIGAAAVVVFLLTPVHQAFGKITQVPPMSPSRLLIIWSGFRFITVTLVLILMAVTFAMYGTEMLRSRGGAVTVAQWLSLAQTPPFLGALLASLGIAVALYYPPKRSNFRRNLGCVRFIIVVLTILGVIVLYSIARDTDTYLAAVTVAGVMMISLLPAQRVYS